MNTINQQLRNAKLAHLIDQLQQREIHHETALRVAYNFGWDAAKADTVKRFKDCIEDEGDEDDSDD